MTGPAVAPFVPYYAARIPYLTPAEYLAAPTGTDVSQLVPGGTTAENTVALQQLIIRASGYADNLCYQVLGATSDMQAGEYFVRDGSIDVWFDYTPVIQVSSVRLGDQPANLTDLTDLSTLWWVGPKVVRIPISGSAVNSRGRVLAQVTYVNGYANTALVSAATAGASSLTVKSALGLFPGLALTVYDKGLSEDVTVDPSYVQGSTTVPLTAPLANDHAVGVAVSALPGPIKEAVISLVSHLVKTRGAEAMVLASVSGFPAGTEPIEAGGSEEYEQALDLLHPFRRVV